MSRSNVLHLAPAAPSDLTECEREASRRVRLARQELGISQLWFAPLIGCSVRTLERYETGASSVPYKVGIRCERLLGVRWAVVLGLVTANDNDGKERSVA